MGGESGNRKNRVPRTVVMGRRFYEQAQRDLEVARMLLTPRTAFAATFHAEQAAEKALKAAYWHLLAEEPAWKHDLDPIAARVAERAGELPVEVRRAINQLMSVMARNRYPSGIATDPIPADSISEEEARDAVDSADAVIKWVETLLRQSPGRPSRKKSL